MSDYFSRDVPGLLSYPEGVFYKTLGITSTGISCEVGHVAGWGQGSLYKRQANTYDPLYSFASNESSTPLTIIARADAVEIGRGQGAFYNPNFSPYTAKIVGLERGDKVGHTFDFTVAGALPERSQLSNGVFLVNGSACSIYQGCIVYRTGDFAYKVSLSSSADRPQPSTLTISLKWDVKNAAGFTNSLVTPDVSLLWDESKPESTWQDLNDSGLFLNTSTRCSNPTENTGTKMRCTVYPTLTDSASSQEYPGDFSTSIPLTIQYMADSGAWKVLKNVTAHTDKYASFEFSAPSNRSYLAIRALSKSFLQLGNIDSYDYGRRPGNFNNFVTLPSLILWGKPFTITAAPVGGKATSCTFYGQDEKTVIARASVVNGKAKATAKLFWSGAVGQQKALVIYTACKYGSNSYTDYAQTWGTR